MPKYLSTDNDSLYRFHQWQANLRVLDVTEIKTVPYAPLSHPFVERSNTDSLLDFPMDSGRCRMAVNGTGTFLILFLESAALVRQPARPPLRTHCVLRFLTSGQSGTPSA
jgi:hypothetical protein